MPIPEEISKYCSSLVVIETREDIENKEKTVAEIQLAHFSVKEYLKSDRLGKDTAKYLEETAVRACIAEVCLIYLLELDQNVAYQDIKGLYSLAQYSAQYWTTHAAVAESCSETVRTLTMEFFSCKSCFKTCYQLHNPDRPWGKKPRQREALAPSLYYASLGGLNCAAQMLLERNADVNAQGGYYSNALQAASFEGHEKVVQMLLEKNADVNAQVGYLGNALQAASNEGHEKVAQMLLEEGADVNAQGGIYSNALQAASNDGHEKVVQMLEKGADGRH